MVRYRQRTGMPFQSWFAGLSVVFAAHGAGPVLRSCLFGLGAVLALGCSGTDAAGSAPKEEPEGEVSQAIFPCIGNPCNDGNDCTDDVWTPIYTGSPPSVTCSCRYNPKAQGTSCSSGVTQSPRARPDHGHPLPGRRHHPSAQRAGCCHQAPDALSHHDHHGPSEWLHPWSEGRKGSLISSLIQTTTNGIC